MQTGENGLDYPVSFFSRKFNTYQKNYSVIEKEALSLIWALQLRRTSEALNPRRSWPGSLALWEEVASC